MRGRDTGTIRVKYKVDGLPFYTEDNEVDEEKLVAFVEDIPTDEYELDGEDLYFWIEHSCTVSWYYVPATMYRDNGDPGDPEEYEYTVYYEQLPYEVVEEEEPDYEMGGRWD